MKPFFSKLNHRKTNWSALIICRTIGSERAVIRSFAKKLEIGFESDYHYTGPSLFIYEL